MITLLPIVSEGTSMSMIADLYRQQEETEDGGSLVLEWMQTVEAENPELMKTIVYFSSLYEEEELRSAYMVSMAITYKALSAQAEVAMLERMAVQDEMYAGLSRLAVAVDEIPVYLAVEIPAFPVDLPALAPDRAKGASA